MKTKTICAISVCFCVFFFSCSNNSESVRNGTGERFSSLKTGDIVLYRGKGLVSDMIVNSLQEKVPVSHCGMIIRSDSGYFVLHTMSSLVSEKDGVRQEPLRKFLLRARDSSVAVVRPLYEWDQAKLESSVNRISESKIPFDHKFDLNDTSALFCTELLFSLLAENTQFRLRKEYTENRKNPGFDAFFDVRDFQPVFNYIETEKH